MERAKTAGAAMLGAVLLHLGLAASGAGAFGPRTAAAQVTATPPPRAIGMPQCTRWEMQLSGDLNGAVIPVSTEMEPVGVAYNSRAGTTRALLRRCTSRL